MSLINCPECGKENVSDSAESCPNCGYNIKAHVTRENIRINEEKRRKEQEEKQKELEEKNLQENKRKINSINIERNRKIQEIKDMELPKRPTFFGQLFTGDGSALTWIIILTLIVSFLIGGFADSHFFLLIFSVTLVLGVPCWAVICYFGYKESLNHYKEIASDFEAYKKKRIDIINCNYNERIENIKKYGTEKAPQINYNFATRQATNTPKCPTCGSTSIKRIGTVNRAASVYAVGLASSKIGKQFECKNCGYKW